MRFCIRWILVVAALGLSCLGMAAEREREVDGHISVELLFTTDGKVTPPAGEVTYQLWYKPTRCVAWISCDYDLLGRGWALHPYKFEHGLLARDANGRLTLQRVAVAPLSAGSNRLVRITIAWDGNKRLELVDHATVPEQSPSPEITLQRDGDIHVDTYQDILQLDSAVVLPFAQARMLQIRIENATVPPDQWERSISRRLAH